MSDPRTPTTPDRGDYRTQVSEKLAEAARKRAAAEADVIKAIKEKGGLFAWLFKDVIEFFKAQSSSVAGSVVDWLGPLIADVTEPFRPESWTAKGAPLQRMLANFQGMGLLDANDAKAIESIIAASEGGGLLLTPLLTLMIIGKAVGALGDVLGGSVIQRLNRSFSPSVPSASEIANVSFVAPELHEQVVDAMKRNGYSDEDIRLLFVSRYALHPPGDIGEMYLRGILDEAGAENRLQELGYTPERIGEIKQLWKRIPTLQDVVRYLGKEAFEPDKIAKFGLMHGFPEEAVEWAAKQGLDRRWAEAEWVAHWRDPGLSFYLDALHRGLVTWPDVQDYMSLVEIAPGLQEIVRQTAYSVYTRVDVRRMYQLGVMNEEAVFAAYKDLGYDDEHALNLTKFTVIDVASEDQPITRTDVLEGFRDGDLSASEAEKLLQQIGYKADRAEYLVYREQRQKEIQARQSAQDLLKDKYTSNLITDAQTRTGLISLGLTVARVNELLETWKVLVLKNAKLPSKTDLDKQFVAEIITEREYLEEMTRLGYSEIYRTRYLAMAKKRLI